MALDPSKERLREIFGVDLAEAPPEEYARRSSQEFVRSQDHLAFANEKATGRRLTAWQALQAFGFEKLNEAFEHGSAILVSDPLEPAATLRRSREARALELADVAHAISAKPSEILKAESSTHSNPIQLLERLAIALGLEESQLGIRSTTSGDDNLAFRLRQMRNSKPDFTPKAVLAFDEAAWVIQKQTLLSKWLGKNIEIASLGFEADSRYGYQNYPAWQCGYDLARAARKNIGITESAPIKSMRDLVEVSLGIPLVHLSLSSHFAGATIAIGKTRGIAVNINGLNSNDWVRRATIAHELGHLLWDPDQSLKALVVDTFDEIQNHSPQFGRDPVEARANAFAIEFLAPQEYALEIYKSSNDKDAGLRDVMVHFGISFTSAKFQVWNAIGRSIPIESFHVDDVEPTEDWKARESFTNDYFPLKSSPISRCGYFSWHVVKALKENLISEESASLFLDAPKEHVLANSDNIERIFDDETRSVN